MWGTAAAAAINYGDKGLECGRHPGLHDETRSRKDLLIGKFSSKHHLPGWGVAQW